MNWEGLHENHPEQAYDPRSDFFQQYERRRSNQKRPTVLVAGYTGSGKTSLIQAICGKDIVPDSCIGDGLPKTQDFDFYQNDFIRFWDSKGLEAGEKEEGFIQRTKDFVRKLQDDRDVDNYIHLVWYTVQGPGARVTPCDLRLIKEIFPNVIAVITKSDITKPKQSEAMTEVLLTAGLPENRIILCSVEDVPSLKKLVRLSYELLPEAYRDAFVSAQRIDLQAKNIRAQVAIHAAAAAAAAAGAITLPFSDALVITPTQVGLIATLAIIYNEPQEALKTAMWPVLTRLIGVFTAASLSKFIPFLGNVIQAAVAAVLTEALGQLINKHLLARAEARITGTPPPPFDFNWDQFLDIFRQAKKMRDKPAVASSSAMAR